jgi:alanine-glyoxylate transaminase / serine-glyoxylate transaminase / serine-pyruvate transaminase
MKKLPGHHFQQMPGPTYTPPPILAAIAESTTDQCSAEFAELGLTVLRKIRAVRPARSQR